MTVAASSRTRLLVLGGVLSFLSIFQMGYSNAYPNTAIDSFREFVNESLAADYSETRFSWLWSLILNLWFIGFAIGASLSILVCDFFGRRLGLLLGNALNLASALLACLSIAVHSLLLFSLARFFFSAAAGLSMSSLILFLQESAPTSMRGLMSFYAEMSFVLTNAVGGLAGMRFVLGRDLLLLAAVAIVPALLSVLFLLPLHETPKFLLLKKKEKEAAAKSLQFYQRLNESECELELSQLLLENDDEKTPLLSLLKTRHLRWALFLGSLCLQLTTSIWPVIYLSTEFLRRADIPAETAELVSTIMLGISALSTVIGMAVVERCPRRRLFLICACLNVLAISLFVFFSQARHFLFALRWGTVGALVLHGITYSLAVGPIAWFITAELVPLQWRAASSSLALALNQMFALGLSLLVLPLYDVLDSFTLLLLFVLPSIFSLLLLFIYLPETRGREVHEVVAELRGISKSKKTQPSKPFSIPDIVLNDFDSDLKKTSDK